MFNTREFVYVSLDSGIGCINCGYSFYIANWDLFTEVLDGCVKCEHNRLYGLIERTEWFFNDIMWDMKPIYAVLELCQFKKCSLDGGILAYCGSCIFLFFKGLVKGETETENGSQLLCNAIEAFTLIQLYLGYDIVSTVLHLLEGFIESTICIDVLEFIKSNEIILNVFVWLVNFFTCFELSYTVIGVNEIEFVLKKINLHYLLFYDILCLGFKLGLGFLLINALTFFLGLSTIVYIYFNITCINTTTYNFLYNFTLVFSLIEVEKELSAIDDWGFIGFLIFWLIGVYILGYFVMYSGYFFGVILVTLVFFIFYFIICGIPSTLLYDYGCFFLVCLRGVGSLSSLLIEFLYDLIGILVFYTRIFVQSVRILLMICVYLSFQEFLLSTDFWPFIFNFTDDQALCFVQNHPLYSNNSALAVVYLFLRTGYEVFHMYFVVTIQVTVFIAIVFWLYLFLYTCFIDTNCEVYFITLRNRHNKTVKY